MSTPSAGGLPGNPLANPLANPLKLQFPQSLAVYDDYAAAQRAVDFLSDQKFPVEQCMIVGTDLKQVERITGRLTTGKVAAAGALVGAVMGAAAANRRWRTPKRPQKNTERRWTSRA